MANEIATEIYKANEWQKVDKIVRATIRMHLSESVYFTVQSYATAFELWKKLSENLRKEGRLNEDVSDPTPLQLADERL